MGDDDEEKYAGVDELFHGGAEDSPPPFGPRVEISKEKYISLFSKWRGALIVKLLGKFVSYRVLDQRVRELWNLEKGFELTDLEAGYFIVRFFSQQDYCHVLRGWSVDYSRPLLDGYEMASEFPSIGGPIDLHPCVGAVSWYFTGTIG